MGPDYLVMEYVEGSPLRGPLPLEEAIRLAREIAGALEAVHANGIIYCDTQTEPKTILGLLFSIKRRPARFSERQLVV